MSQIEADSMLLLLRGLVVLCCAVLAVPFPSPSPFLVFGLLSCLLSCRVNSQSHITSLLSSFLAPFSLFCKFSRRCYQLHNGKWALTRSDMNLKFEIELETEKRRVKRRAHRCQELPIRVIEMAH